MGITVATEKMIQGLKKRNAYWIVVVDENHIGPSVEIDGVTYCSMEQSLEIRDGYPNIIYHFYRNPLMTTDIDGFEFR